MNDNTLHGRLTANGNLKGTVNTIVYAHNYNDLSNKPSINSVTLQGNKTASELGLATPSDILVTSVNEQTGDVELTGDNIPFDTLTSVNAKIMDLESQIGGAGVQSVNGMTGNVTLTGANINYSVGVSLNSRIDAVEGEIPVINYPVTSVNGKTGAVILAGSDIAYSEGVSLSDQIDNVAGEISDLTGADIPMTSEDSTPISDAIGDLSDLTTSVTSSIVGAVNEVNTIIDITSDYITMASGYTFTSGKVYKQGKHIFGNIVLSGTLQGGNNTDTLGTIKSDYRPSDPINGFCGISNGQWFTNNIGYVYIASSGGLQVATTPNGMSYAKIHIDYVTA